MNKRELGKIIAKVEKEDEIFADKSLLSTLSLPEKIVSRERQTEQIVRYLLGYKHGLVVPLISVYGRSGSGKSTIVRFVCENLSDISFCFVNLRKAKTIFGAANLILQELDEAPIKSAQGLNESIDRIFKSVEARLSRDKKKVFVLALDEVDVIFQDRRGNPSDFFYKLVNLEERLREKDLLVSIITVSNHLIGDYPLDERVRSRIGNSEVFFEPYSHDEVARILSDRIKKAFREPVDGEVIKYSASLSSAEHGDARRAIDLLREAAEIAGSKGEKISKSHVDLASEKLQKDRITQVISSATFQQKLVGLAIARITYLTDTDWHATSAIYKQYCSILPKDTKALTQRRVLEFLTDMANSGVIETRTLSQGRHGYGSQHRLCVSPDTIGSIASPEWWEGIRSKKKSHEHQLFDQRFLPKIGSGGLSSLKGLLDEQDKKRWNEFVDDD